MTVGVIWYLHHGFKSANWSEAAQEKCPRGPIWVFLQRRLLFFRVSPAPLGLIRRLHSCWPCSWPYLTMSSHERLQCPGPGRAETPAAPLISLPISPQPNTHPTLENTQISSRRQGVLWLYAGPPITAFLLVPLSNVGHFVRISFCVNMQRWISAFCLLKRDKSKLVLEVYWPGAYQQNSCIHFLPHEFHWRLHFAPVVIVFVFEKNSWKLRI